MDNAVRCVYFATVSIKDKVEPLANKAAMSTPLQ